MLIINKVINFIFDLFFYPFRYLSPLWGLIVISGITGILMLIIFRYTSNQKAIKKAKDKIKAHIFELVLYKDNLRIIMKALVSIIKYNLAYLKQTIIPLLFIIVPVILILIQINFRYQFRPVKVDESVLVKLKLNQDLTDQDELVILKTTDKIRVETPVLRIPEKNEFNWRVRIVSNGIHELKFIIGNDQVVTKTINALPQLAMVSPVRVNQAFFKMIFNPTENPLPHGSLVQSIDVKYPDRQLKMFGWNIHWLVIFFIVSLLAAFTLRGVFKVEI